MGKRYCLQTMLKKGPLFLVAGHLFEDIVIRSEWDLWDILCKLELNDTRD